MKANIFLMVSFLTIYPVSIYADTINPLPLGTGTGWEYFVFGQGGADVKLGYLQTNDNAVWIELDKEFRDDVFIDNIGPIIKIQFILKDPQAVNFAPTIAIRDELIINNTKHIWFDYHLLITENALNLNYNNSSSGVWFDPDFLFAPSDAVPFTNISFSDTLSLKPQRIDFNNGAVFDREYFELGGTNANDYVRIVTNGLQVGDNFLLKEWPTIPEPITLVMLGMGSIVLFRKGKRRQKV